jgi:hypothetical protein
MIDIDTSDFRRVTLDLRYLGRGSKVIAARAINRTLQGVRSGVSKHLRQKITATAKIIRKTIKLHKAYKSHAQPMGWLESRGEALNLIHYRARQTKTGVTFQVRHSDRRTLLRSAFIARLGYEPGVYRRKYKGPKQKIIPHLKYGALPFKYRFKVKALKGPAIPQVLGDEDLMGPILKEAEECLEKNVRHEFEFFVSRMGK